LKQKTKPGVGAGSGPGIRTAAVVAETARIAAAAAYEVGELVLWTGQVGERVGVGRKSKEESDSLHCPSSCGIGTFFLLATTEERSYALPAPSEDAVLGRLAAGVVVVWVEATEATRAGTICCCFTNVAAAVAGAAVSAIDAAIAEAAAVSAVVDGVAEAAAFAVTAAPVAFSAGTATAAGIVVAADAVAAAALLSSTT
jgi:hypothetical protein